MKTLPTITITSYTRTERKELITLRFKQLHLKKGVPSSECVKKLSEEFNLKISSVYYYIDMRLVS